MRRDKLADSYVQLLIAGITIILTAILAYFTKKLYDATNRYADLADNQTRIMKENSEYEALFRKYNRLMREMDNLIAPLYSQNRDQQIFVIHMPKHKIGKVLGNTDEVNYQTYSFWENIRHNIFLNQSIDLDMALNNYFAAIDKFREFNDQKLKNKELTREQHERLNYQIEEVSKNFQDYRKKLFDVIDERYKQIEDEIAKLENDLKLSGKYNRENWPPRRLT